MIVIGDVTARHSVEPLLDWIFRNPKLSPQSLIFIARNRSAKDILSATPSVSNMPGLEIRLASELATKQNHIFFIPAWRFRKIMVNETQDLYAPLIDFDPGEGQYIKEGLTVFSGEKSVGELNREETQTFGFLTNQMKVGNITFRPDAPEEGKSFSLRNMMATTKIKVSIVKGKPFFFVNCEVKGSLAEMAEMNQRLNLGLIKQLEEKVEREMRLRVIRLIHKLQSLHSDPIGFGKQLRAQHYRVWKKMNWKENFPTVSFQATVKAKIIRNGVFR